MFFGRSDELEALEKLYRRPGFQMPVIYGRRRVGKSRLIQEFCRGKKSIVFMAIEQNDSAALRQFSESVLEILPDARGFLSSFDSWDSAFRFVAEKARTERIILAIDEYP